MPNANDSSIIASTFQDGMNTDLNELATKKTQVTYAKNCKFITNAGNQLILQKEDGTESVAELDEGYLPLAVKELGNVAYIISHNSDTGSSQLGSFPSPDYDSITTEEVYQRDWGTLASDPYYNGYSQLAGVVHTLGYSNTPAAYDIDDLSTYKSILRVKHTSTIPYSIIVSDGATITSTTNSGLEYYYTIENISTASIDVELKYTYTVGTTSYYSSAYHYVYEIQTSDDDLDLVDVYLPLKNFYSSTDSIPSLSASYEDWFDTTLLEFTSDSLVDMELQLAYDNSVNMIFTDDSSPVRIVNTRFAVNENGTSVSIINRDGINDTNVYSSLGFKDTELIPENEVVPVLTLDSIDSTGVLVGGSYRYYFKLVDRDDIETNIVQESIDVHIHHGNTPSTTYGAKPGEATNKSVKWILSDIGSRYSYVNVYFSIASGETSAALSVYKIDNTFSVDSDGSCTILHTGYQSIIETTAAEVFIQYSTIASGKTVASVANRLAIANTSSDYALEDDFISVASALFPVQTSEITYDGTKSPTYYDNYSNAFWSYNNSSWHPGETYEFGIVFESTDGLSPVYPIKGSYDGSYHGSTGYVDGFDETLGGINSEGVFKVQEEPYYGSSTDRTVRYSLDIEPINTVAIDKVIDEGLATGFFFVRKQRIEDRTARGFLTAVTAVGISAVTSSSSETYTGQRLLGYRDDSLYQGSRKFVPCPGMIIPQASEYVSADDSDNPSEDSSRYVDFVMHACNTKTDGKFALYVPDLDCSTATQASKFDGESVGLSVHLIHTGPASPEYQATEVTNYVDTEYFEIQNGNGDNCYTPYFSRVSMPTSSSNTTDVSIGIDSCKLSHVKTKQNGYSDGSFASDCVRNIWYLWDDPIISAKWAETLIYNGTRDTVMKRMFNKDTGYSTRDKSIADGDSELYERSGSSVYYGQYLGVSGITDDSETWNNHFRFYPYPDETEDDYANDMWTASYASVVDNGYHVGESMSILGYITDIYPEGRQEAIDLSTWISRYENTSGSYKAITHRLPISELSETNRLKGGDCFVGRMCKQVWHSSGNTYAPTATDVVKYALESDTNDATRYGLGMTQAGFAMEYPAMSKFNFHLRTKEEETDSTYSELYDEDRSFIPVRDTGDIRGWKQFESTTFNAGYEGTYGVTSYYQLDDNPFTTTEFTNRIYVSDITTSQEFSNSFRSFKGLNFRDYNKELGPIIKIINFKDSLITVFDSGIVSIGVDERSMVSQDTGGVYTDSSTALAQKSNLISSKYGSKHMKSVLSTPKFVYGVDYSAMKIWKTDGKSIQVFSDVSIQELLSEFKALLGNDVDVFSSYDENSHNIFFTFNNKKGIECTVMYSELLEIWVAETDSHRSFTVSLKNKSYMLDRYEGKKINKEVDTFANYISDFSGNRVQQDSIIEFVIYNTGAAEVMLNNLVTIGNNNIPDKIEYSSEHISASQSIKPYTNVNFDLGWTLTCDNGSYDFDIDLNGNDFEFAEGDILTTQLYGNVVVSKVYGYNAIGTVANLRAKEPFSKGALVDTPTRNGAQRNLRNSNTTFENGNVRIVAQPDMKNTKQSLAQRLARKSSKIRGKWIKVRLIYTGCDKLYLNSVLSYVTGSYS